MSESYIVVGDCREALREMAAASVHCCVTSPPYFGLRDYGHAGQLGLEKTPDEYVARMVDVFRGVRRVLRDDGTLWLNLGDSYAGSDKGAGDIHTTNKGSGASRGVRTGSVHGESGHTSGVTPPPGLKAKDLVGIPWRVAFALQADGWYLRSDIIWHKPNAMPESCGDRPTRAHEYLFLLSKRRRYYYDADAIREPYTSGPSDMRKMQEDRERIGGRHRVATDTRLSANASSKIGRKRGVGGNPNGRNKRSVWTVSTAPYRGAHFATFPPKLIEPCILAGAPAGGSVLDPFFGAGTTGLVAQRLGRNWIGCELNETYAHMAFDRISQDS